MKTAKSLFVFLLILGFQSSGKAAVDFEKIKAHVLAVPAEAESSRQSLSRYLTGSFTTEEEKFAAIYAWIALNIEYDIKRYRVSKMSGLSLYSLSEIAFLEEVWTRKRGVCSHYAQLFKELSDKSGLRSHVVTGYIIKYGRVPVESHAWNAVQVNKNWYFIDVTWGAGYTDDENFYPFFSDSYFMIPPEENILSRMPFDPLWQVLPVPLSYQEFDAGSFSKIKNSEKALPDSTEEFLASDEISRTRAIIRRMSRNGKISGTAEEYLNYQKEKLSVLISNEGIKCANKANGFYNQYVKAYNNRFMNPKMADEQLVALTDSAEININRALECFKEAYPEKEKMSENVKENQNHATDMAEKIKAQKVFVNKYISTKKIFRPFLFSLWQ